MLELLKRNASGFDNVRFLQRFVGRGVGHLASCAWGFLELKKRATRAGHTGCVKLMGL
jgi:hypothetical protein